MAEQQDIEFMRYLPLRGDADGLAASAGAGAVGSGNLPAEKVVIEAPRTTMNTDAAEAAQAARIVDTQRTRMDALQYGWNNTIAAALLRAFDKPAYTPDPADTFENKRDDLYNANVLVTDDRLEAVMRTRSKEERADLLAYFKEMDALAMSAERYNATATIAGFADVDLALPLVGKAVGVGLRAAAVPSRVVGMEALAIRLQKAGRFASKGANTLFGDISTHRLTNAAANAALGAGVVGIADAVTDEDMGWRQYLFAAGVNGVVGGAFPAHIDLPAPKTAMPKDLRRLGDALDAPEMVGPLTREMQGQLDLMKLPALPNNFERDYLAASRVVQELSANTSEVAAQRLSNLTADEFAAYGVRQVRARLEGLPTGELELENWVNAGGSRSSKLLVHTDAPAGMTPLGSALAEQAEALWKHLFPEDRLELGIVQTVGGNEAASGSFRWEGAGTGRIHLKAALVEKGHAAALEALVHEVGHAVTTKLRYNAAKNGDQELLKQYFTAFKRHTENVVQDVSGTVSASDLVSLQGKTGAQSTAARVLREGQGLGSLRKYHESPLEWLAQQFTKDVQDVLRTANLKAGAAPAEAIAAAQKSALYQAMPPAIRTIMGKMIEKVAELWQWFFKQNKHKAAPEMHEVFEAIWKNPSRIDNYSNIDSTVAGSTSHGLPLEPRAASPSKGTPTQDYSLPPTPAGAQASDGAAVVGSGPEIPYGEQATGTPNTPKMFRWFEERFGKGWYSLYDNLNRRGGYLSGLASMLVHNGAGTKATSAVAYKRAAELELTAARTQFDAALVKATDMGWFSRMRQSPEFRQKLKELGVAVREDCMRKYNAEADGLPIPVNPDPKIEELSQLYAQTGYAEKALHFQKTAGRFGSEFITPNKWYMPMRISSDSIRNLYRKGVLEKDVKAFLQMQLTALFPGSSEAYMAKMAAGVYDGIINRGMGRASAKPFFEGTTLDELQQALISAEFSPVEISGFLERFRSNAAQRSRDSSLRARLEWDWDMQYIGEPGVSGEPGVVFGMRDLIEPDLIRDLERHQRTVSGQYGLGMVGFKSDSELSSAFEKALDDYAKNGATNADLLATREMLDNITDALLGRRVGEALPPLLHASANMSAAIVLKNPAFYMAVDGMYAASKLGAARFIKNAVLPSKMLDGLKGLDQQSAQGMLDVLNGRYIAEGRWKPVHTHLEDGYEVLGGAEVLSLRMGNASRFMSGMEHVRRKLCNITLGAVVHDLYKAARGGEVERQLMARYGATPELLGRIRAELDKAPNGHELAWDATTRAEAEVVLMNAVDQIVQQNRMGEIPAFLQFSSVGKALFPFTSFIAGSWNKVLRKGLQDDSAAGLAAMLAYQIAGGATAEALINIVAGRDPTDSGERNFVVRSVTNSNVSSWFGLMLDSMTSPYSGGAVQFAFPRAVLDIVKERDVSSAIGATVLGVNPAVRLLESMADEE